MSYKAFILALSLIGLSHELTQAQTRTTQTYTVAFSPELDHVPHAAKPKKTGLAIAYTAANTLIPLVFASRSESDLAPFALMYGLTIGPSTGNLYARDWKRGGIGAAVRGASFYLLIRSAFTCFSSCDEATGDKAAVAGVVGVAGLMGSGIYNLVTMGKSVRAYNRRHKLAVSVLPQADLVLGHPLGKMAVKLDF